MSFNFQFILILLASYDLLIFDSYTGWLPAHHVWASPLIFWVLRGVGGGVVFGFCVFVLDSGVVWGRVFAGEGVMPFSSSGLFDPFFCSLFVCLFVRLFVRIGLLVSPSSY